MQRRAAALAALEATDKERGSSSSNHTAAEGYILYNVKITKIVGKKKKKIFLENVDVGVGDGGVCDVGVCDVGECDAGMCDVGVGDGEAVMRESV